KEQIVAAATGQNLWLGLVVMVAGALSAAYAVRFWWLAYGPGDAAPKTKPRWPETAALGALALAGVALALLWLPPVQALLPLRLPGGSALTLAVSLALLAIGLLAGLTLARRADVPQPSAVDWLGLPALIDAGIVRPFERLAAGAAWLNDVALHAIPRGAAAAARQIARGGRRTLGPVRADLGLFDAAAW